MVQKNPDVSTGPLACPFARSLTRSLAHSLAPELVGKWGIFVLFSMCPESLCHEQIRFTKSGRCNQKGKGDNFLFEKKKKKEKKRGKKRKKKGQRN